MTAFPAADAEEEEFHFRRKWAITDPDALAILLPVHLDQEIHRVTWELRDTGHGTKAWPSAT